MPRKIAEFLPARSGNCWQKEVGPGAHDADAVQGNRMGVTNAVRQIVQREGRTEFTFAYSKKGVKGGKCAFGGLSLKMFLFGPVVIDPARFGWTAGKQPGATLLYIRSSYIY